MSMYMGNPSFKETTFRKKFGLEGVKWTHYTVFADKEDVLDYHKDHEFEHKAISQMKDNGGWIGYVMLFREDATGEDMDKLESKCIHLHTSTDGKEITYLFDWSDVELIDTKPEDVNMEEMLKGITIDKNSGAE